MRTKGRDNGRTGTAHSGIALGPWSVGVCHDKERQHTKTLDPATCMLTAAGRTCEADGSERDIGTHSAAGRIAPSAVLTQCAAC